MRRRGHSGRVDANHREIVAALRKCGYSVQSLASLGKGCPDILVGAYGRNVLIEIKGERGLLRACQAAWRSGWRGQVATVRSVDEALATINTRSQLEKLRRVRASGDEPA